MSIHYKIIAAELSVAEKAGYRYGRLA